MKKLSWVMSYIHGQVGFQLYGFKSSGADIRISHLRRRALLNLADVSRSRLSAPSRARQV